MTEQKPNALVDDECELCAGCEEVQVILLDGRFEHIPCPVCMSRQHTEHLRNLLPKIEGLETNINIVQRHQEWRRGAEIGMENPRRLGCAIDSVLCAARAYLKASEVGHVGDINVADMGESKND